jgi:hypothetical protein
VCVIFAIICGRGRGRRAESTNKAKSCGRTARDGWMTFPAPSLSSCDFFSKCHAAPTTHEQQADRILLQNVISHSALLLLVLAPRSSTPCSAFQLFRCAGTRSCISLIYASRNMEIILFRPLISADIAGNFSASRPH